MDLAKFRYRLKKKMIVIEKGEMPNSGRVIEKQWDRLTAEPMPDNISNVQIEQLVNEKNLLVERTEEQIKRVRENTDTAVAELDAAIEAITAVQESP